VDDFLRVANSETLRAHLALGPAVRVDYFEATPSAIDVLTKRVAALQDDSCHHVANKVERMVVESAPTS
jgi:hypothetical protein